MSISRDRLQDCSMISIHAAPNGETEQTLRDVGFVIPAFPAQGDITFDGRKVGYASTFSGLCFTDKDLVWQLRDVFAALPFWYTN